MFYLVIEDEKIKAFRDGPSVPEGAIPFDHIFNGVIGEPVSYYKEDWTRKTDVELITEGLMELPEDCEIKDGEIVKKTVEQSEEDISYKTPLELYKEGSISKEDYSQYIRSIRNNLLSDSDKYMLPDFPIASEKLEFVKEYRAKLRDLPEDKDFPLVDFPELNI